MQETKVKLQIYPNQEDINSKYVIDCLFKISKKSEDSHLGSTAWDIIKTAAKRGDDGIFAKDWKENAEKFNLTDAQYFKILRVLKKAGIFTKSKGKIYLSKVFANHLTKMASAMNNLMMDLGVS